MQVTPDEIIAKVQVETGVVSHEDICVVGNRNKPVTRALVCWMATPEAIKKAVEFKADLLICHESLFFPYETEHHGSTPGFLTWPVNLNRLRLLAENDIACVRLHCSADKLTILDAFAAGLGLTNLVVDEPDFAKIYQVQPIVFGALIERVRLRGFDVLRHTPGEDHRPISRIGLPWGGMGLSVNVGYMQGLVRLGCDALIAGEADSYSFHFAQESGVELIETGHEASENTGLGVFCEWLRSAFPRLEVHHFVNPPAYKTGVGC